MIEQTLLTLTGREQRRSMSELRRHLVIQDHNQNTIKITWSPKTNGPNYDLIIRHVNSTYN